MILDDFRRHSVAVVIPTYNGKNDLTRLLESLQGQTINFDLLIVDSSSSDGTSGVARLSADRFVSISSADFNHGGTRQKMVDDFPGYDVYIFITQDACLEGRTSLENIVKPFLDPEVGAVCGRQLPHFDATKLAQHARFFNYPAINQCRSESDIPDLGMKTAFISNSYSAYRGSILNEVGGFPSHVILSEDMYVAAKMILAGYKVVYAGDATCRHSHNYSLLEEFRRYFDIGVFHARESWIRVRFGGAGGEGIKYVKSELKFLGFRNIMLWPSSLLRNALKLIGYKLGQSEAVLPLGLKRWFGMHKGYWAHSDSGK